VDGDKSDIIQESIKEGIRMLSTQQTEKVGDRVDKRSD